MLFIGSARSRDMTIIFFHQLKISGLDSIQTQLEWYT